MTFRMPSSPRRRRYRDYPNTIMVILGGLLVILLVAGSCGYAYSVSPATARTKVQDAGYNNIHIGSRHIFTAEMRCGKGYVVYWDFTAIAPNGTTVHGRVCKGEFLQGWRINF